jgi:CheY-like chemotaxis protein
MSGSSKLRVLVVDDEFTISSTLVAILNAKGYEAAGYTHPIAALEALDIWQPDVVISDVIMPEMNGIELSLQIKIRYPDCLVILFSGQATTADLLSDAQKHGHEFTVLPKPVPPEVLLQKIQEQTASLRT